jgi:hypothetical protein
MRAPGWLQGEGFEATRRWLVRYQPFILTVTAIVLIAALLPGRSNKQTPGQEATNLSAGAQEAAPGLSAEENAKLPIGEQRSGRTDGRVTVNPNVLTFAEAKKRGVELVANCDQSTGRIMMPSRFAPPCTQKFTAPNGGHSWQGVDSKYIDVVYYFGETDAASQAILTAAGVNDSRDDVKKQVVEWGNMFEAHYNMWGRKVRWHFVEGTGSASDDNAARADALKVAKQIKAFASIGAANNTYVNEVTARGVMCFCTVSQPIEAYEKWYPYVWTTLMASTQGYVHRAAYAGGRLNGKNAIWAGDEINPTQNFKTKKRVFGFIWYETDDHAYQKGAEFFTRYMKQRYGITFGAQSSYLGYPNHTAENQDEARTIIQKFKGAGVTSILCACDPFAPIFFTGEAKRQLYGPEWVITGSALTDTSFFARLYDQDEWKHAFGISYLPARLPQKESEAYRLYNWQYHKTPSAKNVYGVVLAPIAIMYNGFHMAGPVLTPRTFATGLESQPILGRGGITTIAQSYGDKGLWPWKIDPVAADDATEIWWDETAHGEDERGADGDGLYRYVHKGTRYFASGWPTSDPFVFNKKDTVTIYEKPPPQDAWPCYPSPATHKKDLC